MTYKHTSIFGLLFLLLSFTAFGQKEKIEKVNYTQCFKVTSKTWKSRCGSEDSFEVRWKNVCEDVMDMKYAIRNTDGTWEIGIDFSVKPGEETVNVAWVCHGTGHYVWWARPSDEWMDIKFPSDDEIQNAK